MRRSEKILTVVGSVYGEDRKLDAIIAIGAQLARVKSAEMKLDKMLNNLVLYDSVHDIED